MYILTSNITQQDHRFYDLLGSGKSSSYISFIIHMATAILPSSTIFGTDFWVLTEILIRMMPKILTGWLARTVKLNGVLPIAALCLICKAEGPILRVGPRRQKPSSKSSPSPRIRKQQQRVTGTIART